MAEPATKRATYLELYEQIVGDRPTLVASAAESELASLPPFLDLPIPLASLWLPT